MTDALAVVALGLLILGATLNLVAVVAVLGIIRRARRVVRIAHALAAGFSREPR